MFQLSKGEIFYERESLGTTERHKPLTMLSGTFLLSECIVYFKTMEMCLKYNMDVAVGSIRLSEFL